MLKSQGFLDNLQTDSSDEIINLSSNEEEDSDDEEFTNKNCKLQVNFKIKLFFL